MFLVKTTYLLESVDLVVAVALNLVDLRVSSIT